VSLSDGSRKYKKETNELFYLPGRAGDHRLTIRPR
jgi:hypothetical protein